MIALLRIIPLWAFAIAAALGLAGIQTWRLHTSQTDFAQYAAQIDADKLAAEQKDRAIEKQRQTDIEKVKSDAAAQKAIDDAAADADRADRDRMRIENAKLLSDRAALNSRLAKRGKTINDLADLLAKLLDQANGYAGSLAAELDRSRRAGFACERAYDSLNKDR